MSTNCCQPVPRWEGYSSFGVQVITPTRKSWGKVVTCMGPLLIINLGISHLLLNWLPSPGAQKWLRTSSSARCPTNQMTLGKGICQRRERTSILAGSSEPLHGSTESSFHLRKNLWARGTGTCWSEVSQSCISLLCFIFFKALITL